MARSEQKDESFEQAKRIMAQLVRMPPKPHDEMKLGKRRKRAKRAAKRSTNSQ